jgi:hypothetical protein
MRQAGATDQEAHEAAVAAVQSVLPLPWKEASAEAVNAIAYATRYHSDWFWKGAQHIRKWRDGALALRQFACAGQRNWRRTTGGGVRRLPLFR